MKYIFTTTSLLLILNFAFAQLSPIDTDRPDQTESAFLVPKNWIQFETGFNYQENDNRLNEYLVPTLLVRYALSKIIELRLGAAMKRESTIYIPVGTVNESGLDVIELGAKFPLFSEKKLLPQTAFLFHVGISASSAPKFRPAKVPVNFRFSMQHTFSSNTSLAYNAGCEWDGFSNDPAYIYTLSLGNAPSEKTYVYIESFGALRKSMSPEHNLDAGFAYLFTNHVKADISSGIGISKSAPKWYLAVGISARFNTLHKTANSQNPTSPRS